jgi:hypothetical protein
MAVLVGEYHDFQRQVALRLLQQMGIAPRSICRPCGWSAEVWSGLRFRGDNRRACCP